MKLLAILAVAVAAFVVASLLGFALVVRPPRLSIPLTPDQYGLTVEDVTVVAADGARLAGWLAWRPTAPAVILLHGYPAEKADLLPLAAALHPTFTVLLMDFRYFGASEGHVTTLGARERDDLRRTLELLVARGVPAIGVFGFSMGGAVALLTAAEDPRIRAVVSYAAFADLRALGHQLYAWLLALRYPLVELMVLWGRLFLGVDLTRPTPVDAARRLTVPVLLIHSRQDEQIPFAHARRLRRALARNRAAEFLFMDRGRHGELPPDFTARVAAFFRTHLE